MRGLIDKRGYLDLISINPSHVFNSKWWLDAVAPDAWSAVIIEEGNQPVAGIPFVLKKRYGFSYIGMPVLTQKMGPIIKSNEYTSHAEKISYENKIYSALIKALPKVSYFHQNFDYSITNWLPFFWDGYKQTTRYTYTLSNIKNYHEISKNFFSDKARQIKKAKKNIIIKFDINPSTFYSHLEKTFKNSKQKITYSYEQFHAIYSAAYRENQGRSIYAVDVDGNIYCAILIVWDHQSSYGLVYSIDRNYSSSGASSLMFEEAIKYSSKFCDIFDFEGSMSREIEQSYRHFGANQTPYFSVEKSSNFYRKIASIKSLIL